MPRLNCTEFGVFGDLPHVRDHFHHLVAGAIGGHFQWGTTAWQIALSLWCTLLIGWVATLIAMRSHQGPRRDWSMAWPIALVIGAIAWLQPGLVLLSLVYLHPLVGLWILDREIGQHQPACCDCCDCRRPLESDRDQFSRFPSVPLTPDASPSASITSTLPGRTKPKRCGPSCSCC